MNYLLAYWTCDKIYGAGKSELKKLELAFYQYRQVEPLPMSPKTVLRILLGKALQKVDGSLGRDVMILHRLLW